MGTVVARQVTDRGELVVAAERDVRKANKRSQNDSVSETGKRARKESETVTPEDSAIAPEVISTALNTPGKEKVKKAKGVEATSEDNSNITAGITSEPSQSDAVNSSRKGKKRKEEATEENTP